MSIIAPLAASSFGYTNTTVIPTAKNTIDMSTFLRMLTTELANQDPTKPMDDASFFGQIAQMGTVQGMDTMTKEMKVSEASALLGKTVTAIADPTDSLHASGALVTGKVTGLSVQNGVYYLNVQEANGGMAQVQVSNIQSVSA